MRFSEKMKKILKLFVPPVFIKLIHYFKNNEKIFWEGLDDSVPSYQEWDTSLILAKNGANFFHIKEPLFIYNLHSGTTISKDMLRDFNGYQYIINKYKDEIIKYCGNEIWKQHIKIQYKKFMDHVLPSLYQNKDSILSNNINVVLSNIESFLSTKKYIVLSHIKKIVKKILSSFNIKKKI